MDNLSSCCNSLSGQVKPQPVAESKDTKSAVTQKVEAKAQTPTPETGVKKPVTMVELSKELQSLKELVEAHSQVITELQEQVSRKRSPTANGKIQIRDKQTGKVYPSKNNCYQTLLRAGELKDLVAKGVFGAVPEKNNFGWYALIRAMPDRFEEIKPETGNKEKPSDNADGKPLPSIPKKQ